MLSYLEGSTHFNRSHLNTSGLHDAIAKLANTRGYAYFTGQIAEAQSCDRAIAQLHVELRGGTQQAISKLVAEAAHEANEAMVSAYHTAMWKGVNPRRDLSGRRIA